ncbi:MAG: sodium:proton antiporter [Woeseiaceae bacterium]|nr:sodium:proton antiporter [Woeseiaceae bacterium]
MQIPYEIVALCSILVVGFACHWLAWRTRTPAILFLLIAGIAVGPVFDLVHADQLLGKLLVPFVSMGVAIILFEGALTLKLSDIRGHGAVVRNLVTVGVLTTWVFSALVAYFLLEWDAYLSALFGAIVTVSGPTVVMPLLRSVRPTRNIANILRWEAIVIDPLGAILALLVFNFVIASRISTGLLEATIAFSTIAVTGTVLGAAGGYLFGVAIRRRTIPDYLRDYSALAAVLGVYAAAESVHHESGLLAVTVMGIWLANMRDVDLSDVLDFKESLTLVLIAALFILLSSRVELATLAGIGTAAVGVVLILQFVVGPLRAFACCVGSQLTWKEILFLGWIFPRGIVAAAISALFAIRLEQFGSGGGTELVPLVFSVIIGTVIVQSLTAGSMARALKVADPDPNGVLIVGSNPAAIAIATALRDNDHSTMIADSHWSSVQEARMLGIPTFYGSAVSAYADRNLELTGLGNLLALSRRPGVNELACVRFAEDFGRDHVYTVSNRPKGEHEKHSISGDVRGRVLHGGALTLDDIVNKIEDGQVIKSTTLSDEYAASDFERDYPGAVLIFATDPGGRVHFPTRDSDFELASGWTVSALTRPADA